MHCARLVLAFFAAALVGAFVAACGTVPPGCSTASCPGCCDSAGVCKSGSTQTQCGSQGNGCVSCAAGTNCEFGGCSTGGGTGGGSVGGGGGTTGGGAGAAGGGGGGIDAGSTADAGPTHYPDGGGLSRSWDGGSCAVKTDCPCFSSDDCGPGFFCHSEDTTGVHVYCVPGTRGAGLVGQACASEADCLSALCTDSTSAGMRCSAICDVAAECPPTLPRCTFIGFGVDRSICSP